MSTFVRKLGWLMKRPEKEADLKAEIEFHLSEEAEERRESGLTADEAAMAARRDFGNTALVKEDARSAWGWALAEQAVQDLRYAGRMIRCNPAFAALAVLSLALGIGANTAIYSFLDALLLRRLPVADPRSLVVINWHVMGIKTTRDTVVHTASGWTYNDPKTGKTAPMFPWPAFELLRRSNPVLSSVFAYRSHGKVNFVADGQADLVQALYVSGNFFSGLGVAPAAGRLIVDDDDGASSHEVAVLSYAFAHSRFGDVRSAAGSKVLINNVPFTAVGVTPPGFSGVDPAAQPDVFVPMHADLLIDTERHPDAQGSEYQDAHYYWIEMMGRLRPGVTMAQAQAALGPLFHGWVADTATKESEAKSLPELMLKPGEGGLDNLRRRYSLPLYVLLGLVGLILAIACANIANLLLARATARRHEMAVRLGMGAGQWRIVRQMLTESLLPGAIGGAAGVLFAIPGIRFLYALAVQGNDDFTLQTGLNWHVLAASAALTTVTALLFGLAPALEATKVDVMPALRESRMGSERVRGGLRFGFGRVLVVAQIAISMVLLVGAGLFVRTLTALRSIDTGFRSENLLTFSLNAWAAGHRDPEIIPFYQRLAEKVGGIPGVKSVSIANSQLIGSGAWGWPVVPAGREEPEQAPSGQGSGVAPTACHVLVTGPGFLTTMGIPLVAGREFDARDRLNSPPVAIVNQAWLKLNFPGVNPVGQRVVSFGPQGAKPVEMEIVGVAKDAMYDELTGDFPATVYMPFAQNMAPPGNDMTFFVRTAGDPLAAAGSIRGIVHEADARIPVTDLGTEAGQIAREMGEQILFARLCSVFAVLALAIACVGLYGTMSYMVSRRTREIGIRMALGARRSTVVRMVMRDVAVLIAIGLAISVPAAVSASKLVESFLFGVKPGDPLTIAGSAAILVCAGLAAGIVPARRASLTDPMTAIRCE